LVEVGVSGQDGKSNRRLGLILATVALVFFLGFMARIVLFGA